ncbi:MAG: DUF4260 family protein [Anaerolineae bacterium]|nr:DUF4260 family protein [Anaerolineae bacterium]MCA9911557.1 DUF4260 family protein [Anaerolineae bacterium]
MASILLRLEGGAVLAAAIAAYAYTNGNGWAFVGLLLAPDLAMLGYLANVRLGSLLYNVAHFYALPAAVIAAALLLNTPVLFHIGLIWAAHIGMDRLLGYGLKYPTHFKDTHLQHV